MQLPLVGGAYQAQSLNVDCELAMNVFPEVVESGTGRIPSWLNDAPGFTLALTLSPGQIRASFTQDGRTFFVSGFNFYERFSDNTFTNWGTVAVNGNPATMASNGDGGGQLFITSGDHGYCFDLTSNVFSTPLSSGATMCAFLNGRILVLDATNSLFRWSAFEDATSFDALDFAQRTLGGDRWVAMAVINSDIILLGSQTGEAWYPTTDPTLPYAPRPGAFWQQGCSAPFSMQQINNSLLWVSRNDQGANQVMRLDGYQPIRLSTHAIEQALQGYAITSDATAFTYQQNGHLFYVLTFPSGNATWVYDAATELWSARGIWNPLTSQFDAYRIGSTVAPSNNLILAGDRITGAVYAMSTSVATEVDGTGIRRQRRFLIPTENQRIHFISNLQIYGESGVGLSTGQGSDPQLQISWSKDAGHTISGTQWVGMGKQGEYGFRSMIRGTVMSARNPVIDLVCSEPVPVRWLSAEADVFMGTY